MDLLLLKRQRFSMRGSTDAPVLELTNPATYRGLSHRWSRLDPIWLRLTVAFIEHESCGVAFEISGQGTTVFGHQIPLSVEISRPNRCPFVVRQRTS